MSHDNSSPRPRRDYTKPQMKLNKKQLEYVHTIAYMVQEAKGYRLHMAKILDHLYLGNFQDARDVQALRSAGITHIINTIDEYYKDCRLRTKKEYYGADFEYMGFTADDHANYPIMDHFEQCYEFIEDAKKKGGKCFIHCMAGINRSGCLATAYVMVHENIGPISAVERVFEVREALLSNYGFIKQLVTFAVYKDLLDCDKDKLLAVYREKTCCVIS